MNDFKITITSEDLKDPAKLACVDAIVGTPFTNGCITSILKCVDTENECFIGDNIYAPVGLLSDDNYQAEDELTILYSQIKLDPRRLLFTDVEFEFHYGFASGRYSTFTGSVAVTDIVEELQYFNITTKLSAEWLKQNLKCEDLPDENS